MVGIEAALEMNGKMKVQKGVIGRRA